MRPRRLHSLVYARENRCIWPSRSAGRRRPFWRQPAFFRGNQRKHKVASWHERFIMTEKFSSVNEDLPYRSSGGSRRAALDHLVSDLGQVHLLGFGQFFEKLLVVGQAQLERPISVKATEREYRVTCRDKWAAGVVYWQMDRGCRPFPLVRDYFLHVLVREPELIKLFNCIK